MSLLSEIFSWWGGNTWGLRLFTLRKGERVGEDEFGNVYYRQRSGVGPLGVPARWVVYKDLAEPSKVPPDWHGWLHHTVDVPPTEQNYIAKPWQKPHQMNLTGTSGAYRPAGSILKSGAHKPTTATYQAWKPSE